MCSVAAVVSPALFFSHKQGGLFASAAAAAVGAVTAPAWALSRSVLKDIFGTDTCRMVCGVLSLTGHHWTGCVILILKKRNKTGSVLKKDGVCFFL